MTKEKNQAELEIEVMALAAYNAARKSHGKRPVKTIGSTWVSADSFPDMIKAALAAGGVAVMVSQDAQNNY